MTTDKQTVVKDTCTRRYRSREVWRDVAEYEGLYWVSSFGRVKSSPRKGTRGGILKPYLYNGYPMVILRNSGKTRTANVHRLVAEAFLGPCPEGQEVLHLDDKRDNPALSNLRYGTKSENALASVAYGSHNNANKIHCPNGHPYSDTNTYYKPNGRSRTCCTCYPRLPNRVGVFE